MREESEEKEMILVGAFNKEINKKPDQDKQNNTTARELKSLSKDRAYEKPRIK